VPERAFLSIGEVLALLKEEFPDVTISKIRFLESQGLLDPERTPSGYRKFYDGDVERLRWILRQQREHYLPLKVIKGRLRPGAPSPAEDESEESPQSEASHESPVLSGASSSASFTVDELAQATGLSSDDLAELERYGLLVGHPVAGVVYYDEDSLRVASVAAGFMKFGVEARHLRMYRTAAEREASFLEQVVMPMVKQRNPEARRQALDALDELARLGQGLRASMLRQALRGYLEG
jgi:DNA-binding transcriptional MerR regulator